MYTAPPASPAAPSSASPDGQAQITAIAAILGVDPTDIDGLTAAFQALLGGSADPTEVDARKLLSAADLATCLKMGCAPKDFVALKLRRESGKNI